MHKKGLNPRTIVRTSSTVNRNTEIKPQRKVPDQTTVPGSLATTVLSLGNPLLVCLLENSHRNDNGAIQTSTGLGVIKPWTDASETTNVGTAQDKCIVHFTEEVNSLCVRHASIDANNNVWISGAGEYASIQKNFNIFSFISREASALTNRTAERM